MTRLATLSLIAVLLLAAVSTSAQRAAELILLSPTNGSNLPDAAVDFSWQPGAGAVKYKLTITNVDGSQSITVPVDAGTYCGTDCIYSFLPADHQWTWKEGAAYKWQVKAKSSGGQVLAKSKRWSFTADVLPESLALVAPAADHVERGGLVDFVWAPDPKVDEYRIVFTRPDGVRQKRPWTADDTVCGAQCAYTYGFAGAEDGFYLWKVQGRAANVAGKAVSAKRTLVLNLMLDAEDFPPPDLSHPQAAFIFTYDFAKAYGATAEWQKMESVVIDAANHKLYAALSRVTEGMSDAAGDIQLQTNPCGMVLEGDLDASWLVTELRPLVVGGPYDPGTDRCAVENIAEPDNLFVDASGNVWIGEDSSLHDNNVLWRYEVNSGQLERFATLPLGAELTGLRIDGDTLFMNIQHPSPISISPYNMGTIGVVTGFAPTDDFVAVPVAQGVAQNTLVIAAGEYQVLGRAGDPIPGSGALFGAITSLAGAPLGLPLCNKPDGNMFLPTNPAATEGILYTNWECVPGGVSRMTLIQGLDGRWTVTGGGQVDLALIRGTIVNCNASVTPWNTGLSSEEAAVRTGASWFAGFAAVMDAYVGGIANPYDYGYTIELMPTGDGSTTAVKHYAMGRRDGEQSWVAPDLRTVYFGDDGTRKILYRFVADIPGDLSAGTLYAAHVSQSTGTGINDFSFQLQWIALGTGNDAEIEAAVRALYPPVR